MTVPPAPTASPTFGQHSDEVLAGYGYSADEIAALRAAGVVVAQRPTLDESRERLRSRTVRAERDRA